MSTIKMARSRHIDILIKVSHLQQKAKNMLEMSVIQHTSI